MEQITEVTPFSVYVKAFISRNKFIMLKFGSLLIGLIGGLLITSFTTLTLRQLMLLKLPGEVLINLLQCLSIPLIMSSVVIGVSDQEMHLAMRKTGRGVLFFLGTSTIAVVIGLVLAILIQPGAAFARDSDDAEDLTEVDVLDFIFDFLCNLVPENVIAAAYYTFQTASVYYDEFGNEVEKENATEQGLRGFYVEGPNTPGLITFSFVFGLALREIGETGLPLREAIIDFNRIIKNMVNFALWYLPVGMVFLIASTVAEIQDWEGTAKLGMFILCTIAGLFVQVIMVIVIYMYVTRKNPLHLLKGVAPVLVTAFLISSSAATLPVTMHVCESVLNIDSKVSRIILPVGSNINKDGTAVYEVVAVLFIAQINFVQLHISELFTVCVVAIITSIAAPSIPAYGAASTMLVLSSVGLKPRDAALLLPVEWILDRLNTAVNVMGDCFACDLVYWMMLRDQRRREAEKRALQEEQGKESPNSNEFQDANEPDEASPSST